MARKCISKTQSLQPICGFAAILALTVISFVTSSWSQQVVNSATKPMTSTTLSSSLNPSTYGQKVTFTATVTTTGTLPPTGTVVFQWQYFTETFTIGSAQLNSSGVATLTVSKLNADPYPLAAVYKGDANNSASVSTVLNQLVLETTSAATITASPNPSSVGEPVIFSAVITSPTTTPTGPVTFTAGGTVLGTVPLSHGKATLTTSSLPVGSDVVTVIYSGDSNIATSSASMMQDVGRVAHNTWTNGAPMPIGVANSAVGVLSGQIYVVGGYNAEGTILANTQIYNPSLDTWSIGTPLPTTLVGGTGAVLNNILYVMGGSVDGVTYSNAVWAFNPKTNTWSLKAAMLTALSDTAAATENGIIYVIGGNSTDNLRATTVESYNPATDSWKYEAPLLVGRSEPMAGLVGNKLIGFTLVVADGYASGGDTEGYSAATNMWTTLKPDPVPVPDASGWRSFGCAGGIGSRLYVAGGYYGPPVFLSNLNESFNLPNNTGVKLAPMPQAAMATGSAVYRGRLYCLGGTVAYWVLGALDNVQIYQP